MNCKIMSIFKVWILGSSHPNADKSILWDQPFPNLGEPDILIINLQTLNEETLKRIDKEKFSQARTFILDKFLNGGIIIFITAPNFDVTDHYIYSNYYLSPIHVITTDVPEGVRVICDENT